MVIRRNVVLNDCYGLNFSAFFIHLLDCISEGFFILFTPVLSGVKELDLMKRYANINYATPTHRRSGFQKKKVRSIRLFNGSILH